MCGSRILESRGVHLNKANRTNHVGSIRKGSSADVYFLSLQVHCCQRRTISESLEAHQTEGTEEAYQIEGTEEASGLQVEGNLEIDCGVRSTALKVSEVSNFQRVKRKEVH